MCPECTHPPSCVETVLFLSLSAGVWFSAMNLSYFQVDPPLCTLVSIYRVAGWPLERSYSLEAFLLAVLKFTHPPLSNLWDTICEDCNLYGTKFSVTRAKELNRTSSPPGTASSQWAMSEDPDKEQRIPMCLRVDLGFSACGSQGPVICASPREYSALKVPQEARSSQSQWLRNNILNFTTVVGEVTADRKRAAGNPSTSSQSSLRHTHINT